MPKGKNGGAKKIGKPDKNAPSLNVPSHIVEPATTLTHFAEKTVNVANMPKTDFTAVLQIAHDLRLGFNRYDRLSNRFKRQKRVVQNQNFKLMCGKGPIANDKKRLFREK